MKKVIFLAVVIAISLFYACETETVEDKQSVIEVNESNNLTQNPESKLNYRLRNCAAVYIRCLAVENGIITVSDEICDVYFKCKPFIDFGDFCRLLPCKPDVFDVWKLQDILDAEDFPSFIDEFGLKIDRREAAVPFALNNKTAGLQFYKEAGLFKNNVYQIKNPLILDVKVSKSLGLQGNVVKPGNILMCLKIYNLNL